jgi:hypothetical protein
VPRSTPSLLCKPEVTGSIPAAEIWVSTGAVVSPNKRVPAAAYPNVLVRAEAEQLTGATAFVSDGSDLLPGSLGEEWGSTLQRILQRPGEMPRLTGAFARKSTRVFQG